MPVQAKESDCSSCQRLNNLGSVEKALRPLKCTNVNLDSIRHSLHTLEQLMCSRKGVPKCARDSDNCFEWLLDEIIIRLLDALCGTLRELIAKYCSQQYVCGLLETTIEYIDGILICAIASLRSVSPIQT